MTSLTYAIGDLHGRDDLLELAINLIERHAGDNHATLVICGDMVDRGPASAQVIRRLRAGPTKANWEWQILYGNHEDMFLAFVLKQAYDTWMVHGGYETLLSYGYDPANPEAFDDTQMRDDVAWIRRLNVVYMDRYRAFVHAGFEDKPYGEQSLQTMIWSKELHLIDQRYMGRYVVHGHVPVRDGPVITDNKINLDVGAYHTNRLAIAVFENDRPGRPIGILEVRKEQVPWHKKTLTELGKMAEWAERRMKA